MDEFNFGEVALMQTAIEWGQPLNFIWLWTVPAALAVFLLSSWRKKGAMTRFGDPELVERLILSFDPWKRAFKRGLVLLALSCMVLALCQPHFRTKEITVERKGVDIIIAVDVSQSMMAKDIAPTRLDKAKLELSTLIEKLKQDRIGIVAFAGEAYIQCPLTLDKSAVKLFLSTLNPNLIPTPGTAIGSAIRVSLAAFDEKDKEDKAIILLTDGEDHESEPKRYIKLAKDANARIFTIGIGTTDGSTLPGTLPQEGAKRDRQGRVVLSKLDEPLLKELAQATGGTYSRASRGEIEIENISQAIRHMGQKGFRKDKIIEYDENFQMLLLPALIFLLLEWILSERKSRWSFSGKRAAVWALFLLPFLTGFNFASQVKNEEGNEYYKKGQLGKAKASYLSAQKGDPASPAIAFNLGNAYYKEGTFPEAVRSYAQAAKAERDRSLQPKAFYNLGNGYYKTNDLTKAAQYYKEALRLNPNDEDAKYNLELVLKKQQQDKKDKDKQKDQKKDQQQQKNQDQQKDPQQQGGQGQQDKQSGGSSQDQKNQQDQKDQKSGQDQKNEQNQQDQKDQQQQQGGQGQEQEKQEDQKDQKEGQGQSGGGQDQKEDQKPQGQDQDQKNEDQKGDQDQGKGGEGQEQEQKQPQQQGQGQGQNGQEPDKQEAEQPEGEGQQEKPKTPEEMRAEQILSALEGQEKQVMREQGTRQGRAVQNRRYVEKDW